MSIIYNCIKVLIQRFGEKKSKSEDVDELIDLIVNEDILLDDYYDDGDGFNTQYCVWESPIMGSNRTGLVFINTNV